MFESSGALSLFPRRPPTPDLSLDVLLDTIEQDQKQRYRSQEGINLLSEVITLGPANTFTDLKFRRSLRPTHLILRMQKVSITCSMFVKI
jgi:hypothetical protein